MAKKRIGAVIALDGEKEFKQAVSAVTKDLAGLKAESNLVKEEFKGQANTINALKAQHEVLQKTLDTHKKKVETVNVGLEHAKKSYSAMAPEIKKLENLYTEEIKKLGKLEQASDTTEEALQKQKTEVERLAAALKKSQDNYAKAASRVQDWETKLTNAKTQMLKANSALKDNKKVLDEAKQSTDGCAHSIDEYGKKTKIAVESTISWKEAFKGGIAANAVEEAADKMMELGQEAYNTAKEIETAGKQLQASTGISENAAEKYTAMMKEIYKGNYGEGFEDIGQAISLVEQNLKDLSEVELKNVTEDAIAMRDTFGFEYQEQIRTVKMLMDTFQISATEAYNIIATGAQNGLDKNGDLLDTLNEYSVHYKQLGVNVEGMLNSLLNGTKAGTFSVDKLGDAYKEFGIRVKDTAESTTEGYNLLNLNADEMRQKFAAGGETAKKATAQVLEALYSMDDKVKQNQAGVDLFGTMWEDLGAEGVKALTNLNGEISLTENAMQQIKNVKYDSVGKQISEISRNIMMKIIEPLESNWLPKIKNALEFTEDHFETIMTVSKMLAASVSVWKLSHTKGGEVVVNVLKGIILTKQAEVVATGTQTVATKTYTMATLKSAVATKTATAATKAFNAAASLNPLGVAVVAITAAVGAYKLFKNAVVESDEQLQKNKEEVEKLSTEYENLKSSIESAREQRESQKAGIEAEYAAYQMTTEKLFALNDIEKKTNGEKALMKTYIDELNEAFPQLNIAIDEQTGKLNMNEQAVRNCVDAMKEKAMYEAAQNMMTESLQEQMQAEIELAKLEAKRNDLEQQIAKQEKDRSVLKRAATKGYTVEYAAMCTHWNTTSVEVKKQQEELDKQIKDCNKTIEESKEENESWTEAIKKTADSLGTGAKKTKEMGDAAESAGTIVDTKAKEIEEAYIDMQKSLESSINSTISLFEKFKGGQEITTAEMKENLQSQIDGLTTWKENMRILSGEAGKGMTEEFYNYLVQLGPQGANAVQALVDALNAKNGDFEQICSNWQTAITVKDEAKVAISNNWKSMGTAATDGVAAGMQEGIQKVQAIGAAVGAAALLAMKNNLEIKSPSRRARREIGIQIPRGVALGVSDGIGEVENSVTKMSKAAINVAKKELDIHSPSQKMRKSIGVWFPKSGEEQRKAEKKMKNMSYGMADDWLNAYKKKNKTTLKEEEDFWRKVRTHLKKGTEDYEKASEKIRKISFARKVDSKGNFGVSRKKENGKRKSDSQYYSEISEAAEKWFSSYKEQHKTIIADEVTFWTQLRKQLKKGTVAYNEATQKINAAKKSLAQEKIAASGTALEQHKVYYQVSAKAEMEYWKIVKKQFKKGTEERIEADRNYLEAKENLNSQLKSLNEEYVANTKEVQDRLKEEIQSLTEEYQNAVEERADSIYASFGLFDEFKSESASGMTLLNNLRTQVAGYADWELQIKKLTGRGVSEELLEELKEMGPQASAALHSLNTLTDAQLKEYVSLWNQKKELSKSQAVEDMEPMRQQTEKEIQGLVNSSKKELSNLKKDYDKAVKELNTGISSALKKIAYSTKKIGEDATAELVSGITKGAKSKSTSVKLKKVSTSISKGLSSLPRAGKSIGTDTLNGILKGLTNKNAITKSAQLFVNQLKKEMQKAADIHSPSRLFEKEVGTQIPAGVGVGMEKGVVKTKKIGISIIRDIAKGQIAELHKQQEALNSYSSGLNTGAGIAKMNNLMPKNEAPQKSTGTESVGMVALLTQMLGVMQQYFPQMAEKQIVLDTGQLVSATSAGVGAELALMSRRKR